MSSRSESKEAARKARLAAEDRASAESRRQRIWALVGGSLLLAAIVVVILIVVSSSGSGNSTSTGDLDLIDGLPQNGMVLGDPKAPVTLTEFADPQCPFCRKYTADVMPGLIEKYVKSGDVRMDLNLLTFIGADSEKLARAAYAASDQNGMWQFIDVAYARQGVENSGYADQAFIDGVGETAGIDVGEMNSTAGSDAVTQLLAGASAAAQKAGVDSTPSFQVGPTGGALQAVDQADLESAIDEQLAAGK